MHWRPDTLLMVECGKSPLAPACRYDGLATSAAWTSDRRLPRRNHALVMDAARTTIGCPNHDIRS